ncbi:LacI family DNA-binding transcriptional regulator [Haloechinothrix sp. LS1_15]|uniref:LacI family DNA-binding transcriptional regulator n=1 Tax=Haloechinothrix sp. LS1_15 TaxID=2652248 RepID=UPI0029464A1D|nr:LacI family DNA-binding transcriptional regulator [Haloechinothrix sp. LS1_15]MDV6012485.1 LacI family transcriptional regulator [Haloechinothrix sp. LS1_15]
MTTDKAQPRTRPTLEMVAARAGVGRGTVSRVINGSPQVSEWARDAVMRAAEELGYEPNRAARSLVTQRTDSIALVVSEPEDRVFAEPYFAGVVRGISSELTETGMQLWLAMATSAEERSGIERQLTPVRVDGVILLSLHGDDTLPETLERRGVPTVLGGRLIGSADHHYVDVDNVAGARLAVDHLLARGRQRIATITGPPDMEAGVARLTGYREALTASGVGVSDELIAAGDFSERSGTAGMRELLDRRPDLDAVFAASDPMAIGALRVLKDSRHRVPDDVALVGFDGSPMAAHTDPPLTTVRQPVEEMGRNMARLLLAEIRGEDPVPSSIVLAPELIAGRSS